MKKKHKMKQGNRREKLEDMEFLKVKLVKRSVFLKQGNRREKLQVGKEISVFEGQRVLKGNFDFGYLSQQT